MTLSLDLVYMHDRSLCDTTYYIFLRLTQTGQTACQYSATAGWNSLSNYIRDETSLQRLKAEPSI